MGTVITFPHLYIFLQSTDTTVNRNFYIKLLKNKNQLIKYYDK